MRFSVLGSGSDGNATLVQIGGVSVLVDCGFKAAELSKRLRTLGLGLSDISAIFISHEHSDHIAGLLEVSKAIRPKIHCGAWLAPMVAKQAPTADVRKLAPAATGPFPVINPHHKLPFTASAIAVPHDSVECYAYTFTEVQANDVPASLTVALDFGSFTPPVEAQFRKSEALVIDCNHEVGLVEKSEYIPKLKERILSPLGHLSNDQVAGFLRGGGNLREIVLAHLSSNTNTPEMAFAVCVEALKAAKAEGRIGSGSLTISEQDAPTEWIEVSAAE